MGNISKQIGRYVVVMLLQLMLFNQLQLWDACHPYIYIMCLLMMPITLPHSVDMLIGAAAGLVMDVFCNSIGIHMAGCILVMFVRRGILGVIVNDRDRLNEQITLQVLGLEAYLKYIAVLVILHHLVIFSLGAWSWKHMGFVVIETLISSAITILLVLGYNAGIEKRS